ncbi:MAG: sugar ABC transporter permease [Spirochaetes bacterium]|nr:sugar ABC transporter permease [Spirochaetota bacterium]
MNIKFKNKSEVIRKIREIGLYYLWLFPAAVLLFSFLILPAIQTIGLSFQKKIQIEEGTIRNELLASFSEHYDEKITINKNLSDLENWENAALPVAQKYGITIDTTVFDELSQIKDIVEMIYASLQGKDREKGGLKIFSLENYKNLFTDREMLKAFRNNTIWLLFFTLGTVTFGLLLATMVDNIRWSSIVKAVVFIPMAISFVASGIIWKFMYEIDIDTGAINAFLDMIFNRILKMHYEPIAFLGRADTVNAALIAAGIWMWVGFCMVIFMAALKGIPSEIREACSLEGVDGIKVFWHIEIPMIMPTIIVVTTTMVINVLKVFDIVYVMTGGGPYGAESEVIANRMYRTAFNFNNFEYASAMAVILLIAVIPVMLINIRSFAAEQKNK